MDRPGLAPDFHLGRLRARILADWAWANLDREIAAGLPVTESEARRLRAKQLLSPQQRRAVAAVLRNILDAAEAGCTSANSGRRGDAAAIVASRDRLVQLIELLRSDAPMSAPAVAGAELLACDRTSPLVSLHGGPAIVRALDEIAAANTA
jgi:hypothetical protein